MKKSLSQFNYERIIRALQSYKKTKDLDVLLTETAVLTEDANTHKLLRGKTSDRLSSFFLLQSPSETSDPADNAKSVVVISVKWQSNIYAGF